MLDPPLLAFMVPLVHLIPLILGAQAMKLPGGMEHPAILHLYCHLMELSSEPQAADKAANALRVLFPAAGHLTHMASHIDIWAGRYKVHQAPTGTREG